MRILLTNDDGIDAPGLAALHVSVAHWWSLRGDNEPLQIVVVAPDRPRSECGHAVTTGRPLTKAEVRNGWFAVDGTPVDCIRVGLLSVIPEADWVLSGINAGANVGVDLLMSGTFAAAREAAILGVAAVAISHYRHPDVPKTWTACPRWLTGVFDDLIPPIKRPESTVGESSELWNVNLPAVDPDGPIPGVRHAKVDSLPLSRRASEQGDRVSLSSDFHGRPRQKGGDVEVCFGGEISLSRCQAFAI